MVSGEWAVVSGEWAVVSGEWAVVPRHCGSWLLRGSPHALISMPPNRRRRSPSGAGGAGASPIENSVVKVFATVRYPDPYRPWTKESPEEVTGSGVVIEGRRILTNAHVVNYANQVQIQANQAGDKIFATVEFIAPGIDLAILKLEDEKFFDTHPPLARAKTLPGIKDAVLTYGFPEGGDSLRHDGGSALEVIHRWCSAWG